jgi:Na+(H+)/acetate symporter ActP
MSFCLTSIWEENFDKGVYIQHTETMAAVFRDSKLGLFSVGFEESTGLAARLSVSVGLVAVISPSFNLTKKDVEYR